MDPYTALSMEASELERMKSNRLNESPSEDTSKNVTSTASSSTPSLGKDLISFLESPPSIPVQNEWTFFEHQTPRFTIGGNDSHHNFSQNFGSMSVSQHQSTLWRPQTNFDLYSSKPSPMFANNMHRTLSGTNFSRKPIRQQQTLDYKMTSSSKQSLVLPSVNHYVTEGTFSCPISRESSPSKSNSSPNSVFGSMIEQNPVAENACSSFSEGKSTADEVNDIFQRWLNESSEVEKTNHSSYGDPHNALSPLFNLNEWDPLLMQPDGNSMVQGQHYATENSQQTVQEKRIESETSETKESMQSSLPIGDTSKEQFLQSVADIHSTFPCNDPLTNPGYLISPMMPKWQCARTDVNEDFTVKVSITTDNLKDPVVFTCNVNAAVDHVVSQALCIAHEDISLITTSEYRFRVQGRQEFLLSGTTLNVYEYIQDCIKFDEDVCLQLVHQNAVNTTLKRLESDLSGQALKGKLDSENKKSISWTDVQIVKDAYLVEVEKLKLCDSKLNQQCQRVLQTVKAVIQLLGGIELDDVSHSMVKLKAEVTKDFKSSRHVIIPSDISSSSTATHISSNNSFSDCDGVEGAIGNLSSSLFLFIDMYTKAIQLISEEKPDLPSAISCNVHDLVTFNIVSVHRLAHMWNSMYDEYYVACQLLHGDKKLTDPVKSRVVKLSTYLWNGRLTIDGWLTFPIKVSEMPRETKLSVTLYGFPIGRDTSKPEKNVAKELAWVNIAVFNHRGILYQGSSLHGMWSTTNVTAQLKASAMCSSNITNSESTVICVQLLSTQQNKSIMFPPYSVRYQFPKVLPNSIPLKTLDEGTQEDLSLILNKSPMLKMTDHEKDLLWKYRLVDECVLSHGSLARILRSVPSWSKTNLNAVYELLETWRQIDPIEALELLSVCFPDVHVRKFAVRCIQQATEDEIHDYLVQLTQALKYEMFHDSTLSKFLIRSALGSLRIAHKLYWLLTENLETPYAMERYKIILSALEVSSGSRMGREFNKENFLVKLINRAAEAVKYAKEGVRATILSSELEKVISKTKSQSFRLPTNPALVANGIDVENSSYFTSNAIPLRLAFTNVEKNPKYFQLMYKVGDDLRQDVLTMQLVRIMDKLWLADGLDLKIITFACLSTGKERGFIELVSDSITLREIQSSYGLTGAFKDRPIAEWLQKHNPTASSYEKVEENFTLSCAGYCVATYVLGICDRHNDNIMLRKSGHLFHIDFARFLGHAQMFGNIKRDRAPFVLTSDMAYVINGGDRQSSRFHDFVDICCRAFNIIRKNYHIFINLLSLMIHSGIPELKSDSDLKYVYDALKPAASEAEATTMFTRLIETSLSSSFTKFNFFIHSLAQLRFHGNENEDKNSLSFCSKTHTAAEDGQLEEAVVIGYNKRYNPEKYYIYCIRLKRMMRSGESYVYRTYNEFAELHQKLLLQFPSFRLPSFPSRVIVGRSQIKQVAERRKQQLSTYLHSLLNDSLEVSTNDLIYTFFHPMLRDESGGVTPTSKQPKYATAVVQGEIKLSVHHKNNALFIMVMHCRNLKSPDGSDPEPYVKTYLFPDLSRSTKRKTKVARKTLHPTFNEMLVYEGQLEEISQRDLYVSVWNHQQLNENDFLGSVSLQLSKMNLHEENTSWYPLTNTLR